MRIGLAKWFTLLGASRRPVRPETPSEIPLIACNVLPISPKASAALSRRCLQNILHGAGYKADDLLAEADLLLNKSDPKKAIPLRLRETIDTIRRFGNFSAHPINDKTALQIIEVEPHEAEWFLDTLEECFRWPPTAIWISHLSYSTIYPPPKTLMGRRVPLSVNLPKRSPTIQYWTPWIIAIKQCDERVPVRTAKCKYLTLPRFTCVLAACMNLN
jgi:hypothetical protein